jgi:hypothetical protein
VAEWLKRRPAEPFNMGSIPIPGSKAEGYKESTIVQNYTKILKHLEKNVYTHLTNFRMMSLSARLLELLKRHLV